MNRWLAWLPPIFVAIVALTPKLAGAGDGPAHTVATLKAAQAVKDANYPHGVGARVINGVAKDGMFPIPVPEGFADSTKTYDTKECWLCTTPDKDAQCSKQCELGAAVNAPDFWKCDDEHQPPRLTTLNTQRSPDQTKALPALGAGGFIPVEMACNYNHFVSNAAIGMNAQEAFQITTDWAYEIPKSIKDHGGTSKLSCNKMTFDAYVDRVANSLHYVQDAKSEHHEIGNAICSTESEIIPALIGIGSLADLESECIGWLKDTFASKDLQGECDDEVVSPVVTGVVNSVADVTVLSLNAAGLRLACFNGSPLACMGLERLIRHHCSFDGSKSVVCHGPANDHRLQYKDAAYCEGERFDASGQDFVGLASDASRVPFEQAMDIWAHVCKEPDDPCDPDQCDNWCHHQAQQKPGFCIAHSAQADCKRHECVCEENCGTLGAPCCRSGESCTSRTAVCNGATGLCELGSKPPNDCSPDGSGPVGAGGAMDTGAAGEGGAGNGDLGEGGDDSEAGAPNGDPNGGSGAGSHMPPNPPYQGDGWGDPHLGTFDGMKYDFQAVGELTFVRDPNDDMEIQVRTRPYGTSTRVAIVSAVAARVGGDRVALYLDQPTTVNGVQATFSTQGTQLPGGGTVYRVNAGVIIAWPDGTVLSAVHPLGYFTMLVYLPPARVGKVVGLLGGFDGNTKDELHTRGGVALPTPADFETFYGVYAESWRIAQNDSLFDYGPSENTETFTDRSFPHSLLRTQDLDGDALSHATQVCDAAGVTDPYLLDACLLDVGATGDDNFAGGYASLLVPKQALEILPPHIIGGNNGGGLGHTPVTAGSLAPGGHDFFSFNAAVGEAIQIRAVDVAGGAFVPFLQVYDPSGALVSSDSRSDVAYALFSAATSGTYTAVVSDHAAQSTVTADYKLYFVEAPGSNEGGELVSGSHVSDVIDKGDLDSYTFTANAGQAVQLRMVDVAGTSMTPALTVYDPTGKVVSDDFRSDVAYASFNAAVSGTYTVVVYDWSNGSLAGTGAYDLHFVKAAGKAEYPALISGSDVKETIDKGDLDSYTFTANAGESVQLRLVDVASSTLTPALTVYGPTGNVVSDDFRSDVAYASFNAAVSGTYTVLAYDWSNGSLTGTGDYRLSFIKAPGRAEYPALTSGGDVKETIDKGDLDSYTFTANAGEAVQLRLIDVASSTLTPALTVYGPTGNVVSDDFRSDVAYASFNAAVSGTYTVLVYDWSNGSLTGTGDYRLNFVKAPGATEYGALTSGGMASGSIEKGDVDSYSFAAVAGESAQLRLVDLGASAFTPALTVYDPTGNVISSDYRSDVAYSSFTAAVSGTYSVLVYDWSNGTLANTGDYDLYFAKLPGANEGGTLSAGVAATGTIDEGDLDSFTFTATAGSAHTLTISGPGFTPALSVYGPTGALIQSAYAANGATLAFTASSTGTYTVLAYDWSNGTLAGSGDYSVLLQ